MPHLTKLLTDANIAAQRILGNAEIEVTSIASDSRDVVSGSAFIAIAGIAADGNQYIAEAVARGASVIIRQATNAPWTHAATLVEVHDARASTVALAKAFYPQQPRYNFAITGTDGKTSTADFVRQLAAFAGLKSASLGTLGLRSSDAALDAAFAKQAQSNTSPEPILLHKTLQQLAQAGVEVAALEASSHGLDQKRLDGVKFIAAAFTNLTRDHLDYHGSLEAYAAAKSRLFAEVLLEKSTAILNRDDAQFETLKAICISRDIAVKSFGYHAPADYQILHIAPHANGLDASIALNGVSYEISLPLYGAFQLANMLTAIGLLHSAGLALDMLVAYLPKLQGVPGRLEKVATAVSGAPIFVDYAHTPAALENILKTLRAHTQHRLHVVFGCGGDRDTGKRPKMGRAASKFADMVIVTDDNPRSENPAAIRAAIMGAAPNAKEIPGRAEAIAFATQQLVAGDVLVVAGKGHEQTQIIGSNALHFSDAEQIQYAVRAA